MNILQVDQHLSLQFADQNRLLGVWKALGLLAGFIIGNSWVPLPLSPL
jgi:hypothetical protein